MKLSSAWVVPLRAAGLDAIHWSDIGPPDAPDEAILVRAQANDAVVLTRDLDFATMLTRQGLVSPSVVQLRADRVRLEHHFPLVQRALTMHRHHIEAGAVVTLDDDRVRVRRLDRDTTS